MNWVVFLIAAWLLTGVQLGMRAFLPGSGEIAPLLTVSMLVFAGLTAPHRHALWASVVLGLIADLTNATSLTEGRAALTLIGPNVLAYVLACQLVLAARGIVIPRHPLTHGVLGLCSALIIAILTAAIFMARSFYPESPPFEALRELRIGAFSALLTAVVCLAIVPLLFALARPLGIVIHQHGYAPSGHAARRLRMLR